jgi:hypothetical protein
VNAQSSQCYPKWLAPISQVSSFSNLRTQPKMIKVPLISFFCSAKIWTFDLQHYKPVQRVTNNAMLTPSIKCLKRNLTILWVFCSKKYEILHKCCDYYWSSTVVLANALFLCLKGLWFKSQQGILSSYSFFVLQVSDGDLIRVFPLVKAAWMFRKVVWMQCTGAWFTMLIWWKSQVFIKN